MPISRYTHTIWWQGFDQLPKKYESNIKSVIDKNPGWKHFHWSETEIRELAKSLGQEYLDKLDEFNLLHQKVDFGRILILFSYGGVSVDADAVAYKGFDSTPHIDTSDFIVSKNSSNEIENYVKAGIPEVLINATLLVSPQHPILKQYLDYMMTLSCEIGDSNYQCVQSTTGPRTFTKYLLDNFRDQITILDHSYFDPCNGNDEHCQLPNVAILDQQQEGSWANPAYKHVARVWYSAKRHWVLIIAIIAILIVIFSSKSSK